MNTILHCSLLLLFLGQEVKQSSHYNNTPQVLGAKIKTVAIYSSDSSFFENYPIDTLVVHLNLLNKNPELKYYKGSNDSSETGYGADYLVDLKLSINENEYVIPKITEVPIRRQIMREIRDAGGSVRYEIQEIIDHYENVVDLNTRSKSYYLLQMQAIQRSPYKKLKTVNIEGQAGVNSEAGLIIKLINKIISLK